MTYSGPGLCQLDAVDVVELLRKRKVSPAELVDASLARIAAVEPAVNAMVTQCPERARGAAENWDGDAPETPGWLGGLPIGIKDLLAVANVRSTWGTPGLADNIPAESDPLVQRLEAKGGIVMGKTNTPEMGAGGNTFNAVFGMTRNPWNTSRNAGGSSGGSAVALATGEVWLAHGSDLAGSLRTPAAYCGVVGLRPSPGIAGGATPTLGFHTEAVQGPMARNVTDCALFLDAMAGFDPVWPISYPAPETPYLDAVRAGGPAPRIAFSPDLNGFAPVSPTMAADLHGVMDKLAGAGIEVEAACPDLTGLERSYLTLRAMLWAAGPGRMPHEVQSRFKPTLKHNVAHGRTLTADDIYDAQITRTALYQSMRAFLSGYDVLACPTMGVAAGPVEEEYPAAVEGERITDYVQWLRFSYLSVVTALPSLSMPVGFTTDGMPVGLQLIGPPRGEARLLQVARAVEQVVGYPGKPIDPRALQ